MKPHLFRAAVFTLAVLAAAAAPTPAQNHVEGTFARTLNVTGAVDLEVTTGAGSITVRPGSGDRVAITGKIRASVNLWQSRSEAEEKVRRLETQPPIEQSGNVIRIGRLEDRDLQRNVSISYELVVPATTKLRSRTGSGSQTIDGIEGPVEAGTGSGSIEVSSIAGDVRAETGSGGITLRAVRGAVRANTGSGSIRAHGVGGPFTATTGSGSVEAEINTAGDVEVRTGSGGIRLNGVRGALRASTGSGSISAAGEPRGDWRVSTSSGSITARLPAEAGFELRARTSSGSITTSHPVTVEGTIGRREIRGKVRAGGPLVNLSTASGNIRIE
jgi:DUF4097 and DUF4098 domain-containing protein YvlB